MGPPPIESMGGFWISEGKKTFSMGGFYGWILDLISGFYGWIFPFFAPQAKIFAIFTKELVNFVNFSLSMGGFLWGDSMGGF